MGKVAGISRSDALNVRDKFMREERLRNAANDVRGQATIEQGVMVQAHANSATIHTKARSQTASSSSSLPNQRAAVEQGVGSRSVRGKIYEGERRAYLRSVWADMRGRVSGEGARG